MKYRMGLIFGLSLFAAAAVEWLLLASHLIEFIERWFPWTVKMANPAGIWITLVVGVLIFLAACGERKRERGHERLQPEPPNPPVSATGGNATVSGNVINQHFHLEGVKLEDLARSIAEQLKAGVSVSTEAEATATSPPHLSITDGFVQFEDIELQVPSPDLAVGQAITAKYHYANRGVLPVYEVQTWGLMQVLDPAKNSGPHLKAVMRVAAEEGHRKFPGAATLGVQRSAHAFAPLSEPLTQDQVDGLRDKSLALFLLVGGVWVDNQGKPNFWATCQRAEFQEDLTWNHFYWRDL